MITEMVNGYQKDGRRHNLSSEEIDILICALELLKQGNRGRAEIVRIFKDADIPVG